MNQINRRNDHNSPSISWNAGITGKHLYSASIAYLLFPVFPFHQLLHNIVVTDILPDALLVRVI
ncbi:hypothetical protein D3C73_1193240 [compost metagenome]